MKYVEKGRMVAPIKKTERAHKAIIIGIIDSTFVVIRKINNECEVIPIKTVTLLDEVYDIESMSNDQILEKLRNNEEEKCLNDFERFKLNLKENIKNSMLKEKGF